MITRAKILTATNAGLYNADVAAVASQEAGLPFYVACAVLEKESGGKNVWGHDVGGMLSGFTREVTEDAFWAFYYEVTNHGRTSNGVGPLQITWAGSLRSNGTRDGGYFKEMLAQNLKPWDVHDNMLFGFRKLVSYYVKYGNWATVGRVYNGKQSYGDDLVRLIDVWRTRLRAAR